ncbi:Succinate dehydrogenase assembly factor 3, mitochondrial [Chionoecetes opilio]|uniref:Succinate dehydrogenase assembly factor 3 n=1 Tax=Chionoecetes opilio TaxID=41210 RepID=A0A8J4YRR7_CHIOP|nr:Succinate dehydrogenase assembly factor 3, mitochondrial [Chionoecetes opilio]
MGGGQRAVGGAFTHPQRVRLLYKTILKLHRGLPLELRALVVTVIEAAREGQRRRAGGEWCYGAGVCLVGAGSGQVLPQCSLPPTGDQYTKDEFKRNKAASTEQSQAFMVEWTNYAITVAKQLGVRGSHTAKSLGRPLSQGDLDQFNDEQVHQLFELHEAAKNPEEPSTAQNPKKDT